MSDLSYEDSIKVVYKGMMILAVITLLEVAVALIGKGHVIEGVHLPVWLMYVLMIGLSLFKAYFIVYEFMHMKYEVKGLAMSVLLPTGLLVWAVVAFFSEGNSWNQRRTLIQEKNAETIDDNIGKKSSDVIDLKDVKNLN